jgi:hypothetical protein
MIAQKLSYSQTLYRLLAYMGEEIIVTTTVTAAPASGPILMGRLLSADPLDYRRDGEEGEGAFFAIEQGGGFIVCRDEFVEGELMADAVLRIECVGLTLWISFAEAR